MDIESVIRDLQNKQRDIEDLLSNCSEANEQLDSAINALRELDGDLIDRVVTAAENY